MTRYEYFETWLTTEEWKEWKTHTRLSPSRRKTYLDQEIDFDNMLESEVDDEFKEMINDCLCWCNTPSGHSYWREIWEERRAPIRTL